MIQSNNLIAEESSNNLAYDNDEISKTICRRIDKLRLKLLDITRRNPLISTKFSERSNSLVRIIGSSPQFLIDQISSNGMRIISLPDLGTDPKDENTRVFQIALAEARLNNEIYLSSLDKISQEDDDAPNLLAQAERKLKDHLRKQLSMPVRQTHDNLSIPQHAKNHGISPSRELPVGNEQNQNNKCTDIQTLMLPDVMERRFNALHNKERTWREESGISVLHAAFGFLEWQDSIANSRNLFSPLILMPVQLEKRSTASGKEFWIMADDTELENNKILAEKLRLEFNITLPEYTGQGIERYLQEVIDQKPKNMLWQVRRWGTIGVFPSTRLAMYHDLDPSKWSWAEHPLVSNLFGGSDIESDVAPFGDEYNIDAPEIENKVPYIIADADSSQFSTIVDIADGKNLAVEGPPGTGKSQTIVNTIAASLAAGKKVLFVAEKSAALEVVQARLEAYGIGDFLLPLQANRSTKEQIISSIKKRIEMDRPTDPAELSQARKNFQETRDELKHYIETLSKVFAETDFTIHTILGNSIKSSHIVDTLPEEVKDLIIPNITKMSSGKLQDIVSKCGEIEKTWSEASKNRDFWKLIQRPNIDPFQADDILKLALESGELYRHAMASRSKLEKYELDVNTTLADLQNIKEVISQTPKDLSKNDISVAEKLTSLALVKEVRNYLNYARSWQKDKNHIEEHISSPLDDKTLEKLISIKDICNQNCFESLTENYLQKIVTRCTDNFENINKVNRLFFETARISNILASLSASDLIKTLNIFSSISKQALAIRSKQLDDPSLQTILIKQIKKVRALVQQKDAFSKVFALSALQSSEIMDGHARVLAQAGAFAFFSKNYRKAKKFYKSIKKEPSSFRRIHAAEELREISEWVVGVKSFSENKAIRKTLGVHFDDLDTDFTPFEDVIHLFKEVDNSFSGLDYDELRKFIKYGHINEIQSLPKLSEDHPIYNFSDLNAQDALKKAQFIEKQLAECKNAIVQLKKLAKIFKNHEAITVNFIQELPSKLKNLLEDQQYLQNHKVIKNILGDVFKAEETNEKELNKSLNLALNLTKLGDGHRKALINCLKDNSLKDLKELIVEISKRDIEAYSSIEKIANLTGTNPKEWTDTKCPEAISEFMIMASKDKDGLISYSRLLSAKNKLIESGYHNFVELMFENNKYNLCESVEALVMRAMARAAYNTYGEILAAYNGNNLTIYRQRFQESDRKVIQLSRQYLQAHLYHSASPPKGNGLGKRSSYTELALLRHEVSKKKRHISARSLTQRASAALLELKPCWMMSPLAVAQYLPKGGVEFDLLIVDEASQMTPENAIGALLRTKQVMVVGDTNQLPPTTFFRKSFEDEDADEGEAVTEESILEIANACFRPARRLRWHYRSKHSGLISFSNRHVYKDNLIVFPSAHESNKSTGVSYVKVDGIYSAGTNPEEAKVMVNAIINFMRQSPNKSLGVVLLNKKQCDLLSDEMNYAMDSNSQARKYKEQWELKNQGLEAFFIKNLENVQGDERDVIFIGTVYGPEKVNSPVMQRFGPINGVAGKRRLNVLFSRAKEKIVTFSSMTASDIRAEEDGNPGVYMLGRWLEYSASGVLESGEYSQKDPESAFEEHVIQQVESIGCKAVPQVGVKGFSVDIGVKHPDWPHGFIMGVECDGATYHSSVSARDRDRLRQEVLESLGWYLYRIWSTDWFEDSRRETERLRQTVEKRLSKLKNELESGKIFT